MASHEEAQGMHSADQQELEPEEPPTCRICLGEGTTCPTITDPTQRLISPCLCRGTIRHVHISCLQSWRRSSHGKPDSAQKCDQCGYEYDVRQTSLALFLLSDRGALTLTAIGLGLAVHLLGTVGYLLTTQEARMGLFRWLRLGYHRESTWLVNTTYGNILTLGGTNIGFVTFATYTINRMKLYYNLYGQGLIDPGRYFFTIGMLSMWIHNEIVQNRSGRGLAVIGLFMACYHGHEGAIAKAKGWSQWLGETILEPTLDSDADSQDDGPSTPTEAETAHTPVHASWEEQLLKTDVGDEPADDDGGGVARIQIRMPDGKRLVRNFRETDSVKFIYAFVAQQQRNELGGEDEGEGDGPREIVLKAGFPLRDLIGDVESSILSCGLAGEAITVRWK